MQRLVDLIGISETIPPGELDLSLLAVLRRRQQVKMSGTFYKITRAIRKQRK